MGVQLVRFVELCRTELIGNCFLGAARFNEWREFAKEHTIAGEAELAVIREFAGAAA